MALCVNAPTAQTDSVMSWRSAADSGFGSARLRRPSKVSVRWPDIESEPSGSLLS